MNDQTSPTPCTIQAPDTESAIEEIRRLQSSPHANFNVQIHAVLTADQISDAGRRGLAITRLPNDASDQEMSLALDAIAAVLDRARPSVRHQPRDPASLPSHTRDALETISWQHFIKPGLPNTATILVATPTFDAAMLSCILSQHGLDVHDLFTTISDPHRTT